MDHMLARVIARERLAEAERIGYQAARLARPDAEVAAAGSLGGRAVLSTGLRAGWRRVIDLASLVAAATGGVALLGVLCR
jgi:hypothetical protein